MKKRFLSLGLAIVMIVSTFFVVPFSSMAVDSMENKTDVSVKANMASAKTLTLNKNELVTPQYTDGSDVYFYKFTPSITAYYAFESHADRDTYGALYDSNGLFIDYDDDGGIRNNFKLEEYLEKGKTYYLVFNEYGRDDYISPFTVSVTCIDIPKAESILAKSISVKFPEGTKIPTEYDGGNYYLDSSALDDALYTAGTTLSITMTNGTKKDYVCNGSSSYVASDEECITNVYASASVQHQKHKITDYANISIVFYNSSENLTGGEYICYPVQLPSSVVNHKYITSVKYNTVDNNMVFSSSRYYNGQFHYKQAIITVYYSNGDIEKYGNNNSSSFYLINEDGTFNSSKYYNVEFDYYDIDMSKTGPVKVAGKFAGQDFETTFEIVNDVTKVPVKNSKVTDAKVELAEPLVVSGDEDVISCLQERINSTQQTITLTFSDNTQKVFTGRPYSSLKDSENNSIYNYISRYEPMVQENNGVYSSYVVIDNIKTKVDCQVTEKKVASAEFIPKNKIVFGELDYYDCYSWFWYIDGTIKLHMKDGTTQIYTGNASGGFKDSNGNKLDLNLDHNDNETYEWDLGKNYYTYYIGGYSCKVEVQIENLVKSVSFTPDSEIVLKGDYDSDNYYYYVNAKVVVTKKDGTTETYTGSANAGFVDSNGNDMPYSIGYSTESCYWRDGKNYYKVYVNGVSCNVPVTVIGIKKVTFTPDSPIELIESSNYEKYDYFLDVDATVELEYTDGSKKSYCGYADDGYYNYDDDDYLDDYYSVDYYSNPNFWTVGSNSYKFMVEGISCEVPVTIKHDFYSEEANEPTCTNVGNSEYKVCDYCGYTEGYEQISATGHLDADKDGICDTCDNACTFVIKKQPINATVECGSSATFSVDCDEKLATYQWYHSVNGAISGATSKTLTISNVKDSDTHAGYYCKVSYTGTDVYSNAAYINLDHTLKYKQTIISPNCSFDGLAKYECSCGEEVSYLPIASTGEHNYASSSAIAPKCLTVGYKTSKKCSTCGEIVNGEIIPSLGHDLVHVKAKEATCAVNGNTKYVHCNRCSYETDHETTPALGHKWNSGVVTKAPTITATGVKTYTCSVCKQTKTSSIAKLPMTQANVAKYYGVSADTQKLTDSVITKSKTPDADFKGSSFKKLKAKQSKVSNTSVKISFSGVSGADGYIVYAAKCGNSNKLKKVKTLGKSARTYTYSKLKKGTYYKLVVVAYKKVGNKKMTLAASKTLHVATTGGKYTNNKSVVLKNVTKNKVSIKKGKKFTIKSSTPKTSSKKTLKTHRAKSYESTNTKIATVSSKGVITAKAKGKCTVYVYTQNGMYKAITVTVK